MKADVIIKIRFKTAAEGGRSGPIVITEIPYGCPLIIDGEAYDCRILVSAKTIYTGETYELPVKFMNTDVVFSKLTLGKSVKLWEGKEIAVGEIVHIL